MPVDITFVDKDDSVRYFSSSKNRIFIRTNSVLGRKVQMCHPQKSVHKVQEIIDDFKNNKRDVADFLINLLNIRYYSLRDNKQQFLGTFKVILRINYFSIIY